MNNIYTFYKIDLSKLNRDYIKYPLQKISYKTSLNKVYKEYEIIDKHDLQYLYITCRLSTHILGKEIFKIKPSIISKQLKYHNISKTKDEILNDRKYSNLIKYGVENVMMLDENKEKMYQTNIIKYGCKSSMQNKNVIHKQYLSKKEHNTFNSSKDEDIIYNKLLERYGEVIRQYKSEKYPFACDFYIPSEELYIEYQGFKSHNYEPYDKNNPIHQEKVQKWINYSQYNKSYLGYLKVWTVKDPLKRKTAKDNNLNWIEFFNMNEFNEWYNKKEE